MSFTPDTVPKIGERDPPAPGAVQVRSMTDVSLTSQQRTQLSHAFELHKLNARASLGTYLVKNGKLADGTPYRIVTNGPQHAIYTWPSAQPGKEPEELSPHGIGMCVTALDGSLLGSFTMDAGPELGNIPQPLLLVPARSIDPDTGESTSTGVWKVHKLRHLTGGQRLWRSSKAKDWLTTFATPSAQQVPGSVVSVGPAQQTLPAVRRLHNFTPWAGSSGDRMRFEAAPNADAFAGSRYNFRGDETFMLRYSSAAEARSCTPSFVARAEGVVYGASAFAKTFGDGSLLVELVRGSPRAAAGLWKPAATLGGGAYLAGATSYFEGDFGTTLEGALSPNASGTKLVVQILDYRATAGAAHTGNNDRYLLVDNIAGETPTGEIVDAGIQSHPAASPNTWHTTGSRTASYGFPQGITESWGHPPAHPEDGMSNYAPFSGAVFTQSFTHDYTVERSYSSTRTDLNRVFFDFDDTLVKEAVTTVLEASYTESDTGSEDGTNSTDPADYYDSSEPYSGFDANWSSTSERSRAGGGDWSKVSTLALPTGTFTLEQTTISTDWSIETVDADETISQTLDLDSTFRNILLYDRKLQLIVYLDLHIQSSGTIDGSSDFSTTMTATLKVKYGAAEVFSQVLRTLTPSNVAFVGNIPAPSVSAEPTNTTTMSGTRILHTDSPNPGDFIELPYSETYWTEASGSYDNSEASGEFTIGGVDDTDFRLMHNYLHVYCARDPVTLAYAVNVQIDADKATEWSCSRNWFWLFDSQGLKDLHTVLGLEQPPVVWEAKNLNSLVSI